MVEMKAELWRLISFFEAEPVLPHAEDGRSWDGYSAGELWPNTELRFVARSGKYTIVFDLEPCCHRAHLLLRGDREELLDLELSPLHEVELDEVKGEVLVLRLEDELGALRLRLRPSFLLSW
jgi:hypothetical protein